MTANFLKILFILSIVITLIAACDEKEAQSQNAASTPEPPAAPVVKDGTAKLMFSWFEGNEAQTAMDIEKVPDDVKKEVRVQDLSVPPDKRDPDWIFLADLTQKNATGRYEVRTVHRDKYEQKRHPKQKKKTPLSNTPVASSQANVIMYATPHCPHCKKARRWLLEQKIPYKEVNVEKDQVAAAALAQKGLAQGVPTGGVPMFEIHGRLIPGFDPAAIRNALTQPKNKATPRPPAVTPPKEPSPPSAITI